VSTVAAPTDEDLAARAATGDTSAFEALVSRHQGRVHRVASRLAGSEADAQDVLQETFLAAYRRLGSFRGEARFSTWLCRIAANAARMQRRRQRRRPTEPLDDYLPKFDADGMHAAGPAELEVASRVDEVLDRKVLATRAREGLERLPDTYREAFVLRDLEEMTSEEVAGALGISAATVRQRVHRARLMLRGWLAHLAKEAP
jgi:RNA polymerase sigma-70 factor, ECF subfamily